MFHKNKYIYIIMAEYEAEVSFPIVKTFKKLHMAHSTI